MDEQIVGIHATGIRAMESTQWNTTCQQKETNYSYM